MIVNIVMLLTYEVCVLFVDNVKAKVFKEYSAGFPCYSLLHTFELEAEEYMVDMISPWSGMRSPWRTCSLPCKPGLW